MMRRRLVMRIAALGLAALLAGCGQQANSANRATPVGTAVGMQAPSLELTTLAGPTLALPALRGKVVLVNFWATWCGPCLMEMPSMERLYQKFGHNDFEIVAISADYQGEPVVKPFVDRLRLTFPVLLDPDSKVVDLYQVTGLPTSLLVDRDGVITHKFMGARNWDSPTAQETISQLLRHRT